jgi:hypothetical protein
LTSGSTGVTRYRQHPEAWSGKVRLKVWQIKNKKTQGNIMRYGTSNS